MRLLLLLLAGSATLGWRVNAWAPGDAPASMGEAGLRRLLEHASSGTLRLPPGSIEITRELALAPHARNLTIEGDPAGTLLRAAAGFTGRAVLTVSGASGVTLRDFLIDGNRLALERPVELLTRERPFSELYGNNGILVEKTTGVTIARVKLRAVANYAVIATACSHVIIEEVEVSASGSRNPHGRNNASGGILLEEGTTDFTVRRSRFRDIRGNAVWTHSGAHSPRNRDGVIRDNRFETIARDAVQIGHAVRVRVEANTGRRIGYPTMEVDIENGATPAGIGSSGNVGESVYTHNHFEELNGECLELNGFHNGAVTFNTCVSRGTADDYPSGHFAIVVNSSDPSVQSENITIADNLIDGVKFGGLFLIGRNHRVERNRMLNLNLAHCNESAARYGCVAIAGEPLVLEAGIYLGRIGGASRGHVITGNTISGYRMRERAILAAPGVSPASSRIEANTCEDSAGDRR